MATGQNGSAILVRNRDHATLACSGSLQHVSNRRRQQTLRGTSARLLPRSSRGIGGNVFVAVGGGTINLACAEFVPFVADDAMAVRAAAGQERGVTGPGERQGIRIIAVVEPGSLFQHASEATLAELVVPTRQIIGTHLVEYDENYQLWFGLSRRNGLFLVRVCRQPTGSCA